MSAPALSVQDLTVQYGARTALHRLSFEMPPGEVLGLIGPNGAGKTTLVKAICGQITPRSGTLFVDGTPIKRGAENRKRIGLVPQDIGLYGHLTARENLDVFARMMGLRGKARRAAVDAALESVSLTSRARERTSHLSGGMKRRINYAAAILHRPALLILDEPTAGVDAPARDAIHALTKSLTDTGMSVLLITHELEQAEQICDRVLILSGGHKYGLDSPQALLDSAFGSACDCILTLPISAKKESIDALQRMGFGQAGALDRWSLSVPPQMTNPIASLSSKLSSAGIDIKEIIIQKPGLANLMYQLESKTNSDGNIL